MRKIYKCGPVLNYVDGTLVLPKGANILYVDSLKTAPFKRADLFAWCELRSDATPSDWRYEVCFVGTDEPYEDTWSYFCTVKCDLGFDWHVLTRTVS